MEGDNVRVVHDDSGDEPKRRDSRSGWWMAAATALGVVVFVVFLVANPPSTGEPRSDPPPGVPDTTTTPIPAEQAIRGLGNGIEPDVRTFCERASPVGAFGLKDVEAWRDSVGQSDFETAFIDAGGRSYPSDLPIVLAPVFFEILEAQANMRQHHQVLLYSVTGDLEEVGLAVAGASRALDDGNSDEFTYQVARIERHCASAISTVETMKAMSATVDRP